MNRLHRAVCVFVSLLALVAGAHAQTTTITASNEKMGGYPISTGTVTITPVSLHLDIPIAFADGTGAQNGPTAFQCAITAGAITGQVQNDGSVSGTCSVPDSADTIPANILYAIQVCDTSTGLRTSGSCFTLHQVVGVTGASWALDHYGPPSQTTNVQVLQATQGSTTPGSCQGAMVFTNTTTQISSVCVSGVLVPISGVAQVVGAGTNATIQAAITAAGTADSVQIPPSYKGTDTYTNPNSIQIQDNRLYNLPNTLLQMQSVFPLMDMTAGGNVAQFASCIAKKACTVVWLGDSIFEGISAIASQNNVVTTLENSLRQHYPDVAWNFINYSIGGEGAPEAVNPSYTCSSSAGTVTTNGTTVTLASGPGFGPTWASQTITINGTAYTVASVTSGSVLVLSTSAGTQSTPVEYGISVSGGSFVRPDYPGSAGGDGAAYSEWPTGCTAGQSWLWQVQNAAPDAVIMAFGQNDAGVGLVTEVADLKSLISSMAAFSTPPTVVLATNTESTLNTTTFPTSATQNPVLLQIMQAQRDLGKQLDLPVMDAGRLYLLYRDGTDYARSRFTMQPDFTGYPSGLTPSGAEEWTTSGSASIASGVLTLPSGNNSVALNQSGTDFVFTAQFAGMTTGSTQTTSSSPTFFYRTINGGADKYTIKINRCNASCSTPNLVQVALYYDSTLIASANGVSTATTLNVWGRVIGAHHEWYVLDNSLGNAGQVVASIDAYDYTYLGPGVSGVGMNYEGGTVSLWRDYIGNPQTVLAAPVIPEASLIGINDWYPSNPWNSMGGDAIHHPSAIGFDAFYAAAFAPVLNTVDRAVAAIGEDNATYIRSPNYSSAMVDNGNFELGTTGWESLGAGVTTLSASSESPWTNGKSLAITTAGQYDGASPLRRYAVVPGQTYNLSAYVKSDGVFSVFAEIIAYDGAGNVLSNAVTSQSTSTSWTPISASFVMPANASSVGIEFARYDAGGASQTGYVSGVTFGLSPVPTPVAFASLGSCSSTALGIRAITDSTSATPGTVLTVGGGSIGINVQCIDNASNYEWIVD